MAFVQAEALSDLRGFSFFNAARGDYLRELCETVTGKPFSGSRAELEALCQSLKEDQHLWEHLAAKGIEDITRHIVMTAFELTDLRRRMSRMILDEGYYGDDEELQDLSSRLEKKLFDMVQRRNRLIKEAFHLQLSDRLIEVHEHKLLRIVMDRLRNLGWV